MLRWIAKTKMEAKNEMEMEMETKMENEMRYKKMRVKQVSENRIFWTLGKGKGDEALGVEFALEGGARVRRTIFSRGKYGKEKTIFEEIYGTDEFFEIIRNEELLLPKRSSSEGEDAKQLLTEAMEKLRRVCDGL